MMPIFYVRMYRICPNRSQAQIEAGARIEARSERRVS